MTSLKTQLKTMRRKSAAPSRDLTSIDPKWAWQPYGKEQDQSLTTAEAVHLLRRSGFGAPPAEVKRLTKLRPVEAVQSVVSGSQGSVFETQAKQIRDALVARNDANAASAWWLYRMLHTPDPFKEKMTLFWHGHFATSAAKVTDPKLMIAQNEILRKHCKGDFEALVKAISRDPAMLIYLDATDNRKSHPNENYARELLELFCLGLGNYTERDIQELSRCFTGWEVRRGRFRENSYMHDKGEKSFLGSSGSFDGDQAVEIVLQQKAAPRFIARKLIRFFLIDDVTIPGNLVAPLADQLRADDFHVEATIKRMLCSNLFFSEHVRSRKVIAPIELTIGFLRTTNSSRSLTELATTLNELGQKPMFPPNVKGWDGGSEWINSSTMLGRINFIQKVVNSDETQFKDGQLADWVDQFADRGSESLVAFLTETFLTSKLDQATTDQLISIAEQFSNNRTAATAAVLTALGGIPEFQLT